MQMESRRITFEMDNGIPGDVTDLKESYLANWDLINQTIFHPFVNAVKFNKIRGSIKVSIKIQPGNQRNPSSYFVCEINDTGAGISDKKVK